MPGERDVRLDVETLKHIAEIGEVLKNFDFDRDRIVVGPGGRTPRPAKPFDLKTSKAMLERLEQPIRPAVLDAKGTRKADGRLVPLVLCVVRDTTGRTQAGIRVHLYDEAGALVDRGATDRAGVALLRFGRRAPRRDQEEVKGVVEVLDGPRKPVSVDPDRQHTVLEVTLDALPEPMGSAAFDRGAVDRAVREALAARSPVSPDPPADDGETGGNGHAPVDPGGLTMASAEGLADAAATAAAAAVGSQLRAVLGADAASDLFGRLPADFDPALCEEISRLAIDRPDPLLGGALLQGTSDPVLGGGQGPASNLTRRTPIVRRLVLPRVSSADPRGAEPGRYLVRVRQRWVFAGYSLGELADVEGLDPGAVLREVTSAVQRSVSTVERSADEQVRQAVSTVVSRLQQLSSVDNVVKVATDATTSQTANGFAGPKVDPVSTIIGGVIGGVVAGPLGALVGGGIGALVGGAGVQADVGTGVTVSSGTTTTTNIDTSLQVNQLTQTSASLLNRVVRTASSATRELEQSVQNATDRVSPLLSRVTNLLRWTLYENYIVCSEVEDVLEVHDIPLAESLGDPGAAPLFTAADVLEYRRLFEPALLDPALRGRFDALRAMLEAQRTGRLVRRVTVRCDYSAIGFSGVLRINIGATELALRLAPGDSTAAGTLHLPPTPAADLGDATVSLTAVDTRGGPTLWEILTGAAGVNAGSVRIRGLRLWYDSSPGGAPDQRLTEGQLGLVVDRNGELDVSGDLDLVVPEAVLTPEDDPLVAHVNRNRSHYLGVLGRAALLDPALRDDSRHLAAFGSPGARGGDAAIWRLPIVGFEGGRALVLAPPADDDAFAKQVRAERGAGTLVQLAAPGAYAEALQGLLQLEDAADLLHPALLAPPSPLLMPAALVDAQNGTMTPLQGGVVPIPGTADPLRPPAPGNGLPSVPGVPVP